MTKRKRNRTGSTISDKKKCSTCPPNTSEKCLTEFPLSKCANDGHHSSCKDCRNKQQNERRKTHREFEKIPFTVLKDAFTLLNEVLDCTNQSDFEPTIHCTHCKKDLPITSFNADSSNNSGLNCYCKDCVYDSRMDRTIDRIDEPISNQDKKCSTCNKMLPAEEFSVDLGMVSGLHSCCRECDKKDYRLVQDWRDNTRKKGCCVICGYKDDFRALDFAHINRDDKRTSTKTGQKVDMAQIKTIFGLEEEFKKCQLMCRNCHRMETFKELQVIKETNTATLTKKGEIGRRKREIHQQIVNTEKLKREKCSVCNIKVTNENYSVFDFDHVIPEHKTNSVAHLVGSSKDTIFNEMEKCDLKCARCHVIKSLDSGELGIAGHREETNTKKVKIMEERKAGTHIRQPKPRQPSSVV